MGLRSIECTLNPMKWRPAHSPSCSAQSVNHIEVGEHVRYTVDIVLSIRSDANASNTADATPVGRRKLTPEGSAPSGRVQFYDWGWDCIKACKASENALISNSYADQRNPQRCFILRESFRAFSSAMQFGQRDRPRAALCSGIAGRNCRSCRERSPRAARQ